MNGSGRKPELVPDRVARPSPHAPVLLLRGQQTALDTWFADGARHIAQHVADADVRALPGVGHFAPLLSPEPLADELINFFASIGNEVVAQPA